MNQAFLTTSGMDGQVSYQPPAKLIVILIHSFFWPRLSNTTCDGKQLLDPGGGGNKRKERKDESFEFKIIIMSVFPAPWHKGSRIPYSAGDNDSRRGVSPDERGIAGKFICRGTETERRKDPCS